MQKLTPNDCLLASLKIVGLCVVLFSIVSLSNEVYASEDIPSDAKIFNNHSYLVVDESMNWSMAKVKCEVTGGHLVTITSADEQSFLQSQIIEFGSNQYWIGGTDEGSEGMWKWITSETWNYEHWDSPEPNGRESENYAAIFRIDESHKLNNQFFWNDLSNEPHNSSYPFYDVKYIGYICEWDYHTHIKTDGIIIRNSTCYDEGIKKTICAICGIDSGVESIPKIPHIPNEVWQTVREATCTHAGERVQLCTVCGNTALQEQIPVIPHTFNELTVISGNKFIPPIVTEGNCIVCGLVVQEKNWGFAWLSPLLFLVVIIVVVISRSLMVKSRKTRTFVCPNCQMRCFVTDVDFRCINSDCKDVFSATLKSGKVPQFATCPKCGKRTSELVCPSCRKQIPNSVVFSRR